MKEEAGKGPGREPDQSRFHSHGSSPPLGKLEELGDLHSQSAAWGEAATYYLSALEEDPQPSREVRVRLHFKVGDVQRRQGHLDEAHRNYQTARLNLEHDDERGRARLEIRLARIAYQRGEYQHAVDLSTAAFASLATTELHHDVAFAQLTLGNSLQRLGRPQKAVEFFEDALATFRRIGDGLNQAHVLHNLGILAKNACRWSRALRYYDRAETLFREHGATWELVYLHLNRAILQRKMGEHHAAMDQAERGLQLARRLGDQGRQSKLQLLLGQLHVDSARFEEAEKCLLEARVLAERQGARRELALSDEFLGDLMRAQGLLREAAGNYALAEERALAISANNDILVEIWRRQAELALEEGDYPAALALAERGLQGVEQCGEEFERSFLEAVLGDALAAEGQLVASLRAHDRAIEAARQLRLPYRLVESLRRQARVHGQRGEDEDLLRAAQLLQEALDLPGQLSSRLGAELHLELAGLRLGLGDHEAALLSLFEIDRLDPGLAGVDALRTRIENSVAEGARDASSRYQLLSELPDVVRAGEDRKLTAVIEALTSRLVATRVFLARQLPNEEAELLTSKAFPLALGRKLAGPLMERLRAEKISDAPRVWAHNSIDLVPGLPLDGESVSAIAFRLQLSDGAEAVAFAEGQDLRLDPEALAMARALLELAAPALEAVPRYSEERKDRPDAFAAVLSESESMYRVLELCEKVAPSPYTVLLTGETGTGKGLLARTIHELSPRAARRLITVNCAALPETLLESELFGYVKGAFTGAERNHEGLVLSAQGGTLFLDEVGKTSLPMQAKLLQFLDSKEIRPVGSNRTQTVDVRVVVASKVDLRVLVEDGRFLEDLYFRLVDFPIRVPPLRERGDDVLLLARHYVRKTTKELGCAQMQLTRGVIASLRAYEWPGNVRELEKIIKRAVVLAGGDDCLREPYLPGRLAQLAQAEGASAEVASLSDRSRPLREQVIEVEALALQEVLQACGWNKSEAARRLEISYPTLLNKIRTLGIKPLSN